MPSTRASRRSSRTRQLVPKVRYRQGSSSPTTSASRRITQVEELGEVETPILLTNTLSVLEAMAASIEWTLAQAGNAEVRTVYAVVGETNDGRCDDGGVRQGTRAA
jgi:L-aminopeptidase/D-esterase-like protein